MGWFECEERRCVYGMPASYWKDDLSLQASSLVVKSATFWLMVRATMGLSEETEKRLGESTIAKHNTNTQSMKINSKEMGNQTHILGGHSVDRFVDHNLTHEVKQPLEHRASGFREGCFYGSHPIHLHVRHLIDDGL